MARGSHLNPKVVGIVLFAAVVAVFAVLLGTALSPSAHAQEDANATDAGATVGSTEGWFNGKTVTFLYTRPYFCGQPPASGADSGCEVGADAQTARSAIPTSRSCGWSSRSAYPTAGHPAVPGGR